ncbi:MAG TPA: adenylyl-sulfate kinase [Verrucomicrobiota bacterium]|nr:adenylyl-sulfate kinase [Verrucomicrobiales bacterium]HRI15360.1 adenylyl-sulfate kinase [Verrucomicrobiota bacterium]
MLKVFWLFGRSGAGKTTLANRLRDGLRDQNLPVLFLDGDLARSGLSSDLGYHPGARTEHHRRIAEVARMVSEQGMIPVVATMAPEYEQRDLVAKTLGSRLVWVFVDAPLDECIRRDPKGLYRRAQEGKITNLIDYPFETPRPAEREITINTTAGSIDDCYRRLMTEIMAKLSDYVI